MTIREFVEVNCASAGTRESHGARGYMPKPHVLRTALLCQPMARRGVEPATLNACSTHVHVDIFEMYE